MTGKIGERECDKHMTPEGLLAAFKDYCDRCERNCPMGCVHRKVGSLTQGALTFPDSVLDPHCSSIMMCFAQFAQSKVAGATPLTWHYKPHTGGLVESLKQMQEFDSLDEMFDWIVEDWSGLKKLDRSRLFLCAEEQYDARIGAYLHYIGYCDRNENGSGCASVSFGIPQCIGHAFIKYDRKILEDAIAGKIDFDANARSALSDNGADGSGDK